MHGPLLSDLKMSPSTWRSLRVRRYSEQDTVIVGFGISVVIPIYMSE